VGGSSRKRKRLEHMFNMLNTWFEKGKNSPMVCKFLSKMSAIRHSFALVLPPRSYLLERVDLRNRGFQPVGLRIAFPIRPPVFRRIHGGKD
jgi:hypothetical protein